MKFLTSLCVFFALFGAKNSAAAKDDFSDATCSVEDLGFSLSDRTESIFVKGGKKSLVTFTRYSITASGYITGYGDINDIYSVDAMGDHVVVQLDEAYTDKRKFLRYEFRGLPKPCVREIGLVWQKLRQPKG